MSELGGAPAWAVRGTKVVCIHRPDTRSIEVIGLPEPVVGHVYTLDGWAIATVRGIWIGLVEMSGKSCFRLDFFRPLVTRTEEQDLAIFAPLLGTRQPELERT